MIEQKVNRADKIEKIAIPTHLRYIEQEHEVINFLRLSRVAVHGALSPPIVIGMYASFMFTNQNGILRRKNNTI